MNSPHLSSANQPADETTRARFWQERKWQWATEAIVFGVLGITCTWPVVAAAVALVEFVQRFGA